MDQALEGYNQGVERNKLSAAKILGFGAAAAGGLLTCGQVDADIIHTGPGNGAPASVPQTGPRAGYLDLDIDLDGDIDMAFGTASAPGFVFIPTAGTGTGEDGAKFLTGGFSNGGYFPRQMGAGELVSGGAGTFLNSAPAGWAGQTLLLPKQVIHGASFRTHQTR